MAQYAYVDNSGFAEVFSAAYGIVFLVVLVVGIVAGWRIFEKANEPGWAAIVPFYSSYKMYQISWGTGWLFLLQLVPCVGVVVSLIMNLKLAKAFGKGTGFGIGLFLLPFIFQLILGFGSAEYEGPQA
ncbi:MAG: DUF5684 domain-containing protein [bacterium]|nr:DUF5684 domain-containing protein [bacterium]